MFGEIIWRSIVEALQITFWVMGKLFGLGVGATRAYNANRARHYHPKQLRHFTPMEMLPFGVEAYIITLPKQTQWDPETALHFIQQLTALTDIAFQIEATSEAIQWRIINWVDIDEGLIERTVTAFYPQASVTRVPYLPDNKTYPIYRRVFPYQLANIFPAPIYTHEQVKKFDPLSAIIGALSDLHTGERITLTLGVTDQPTEAVQVGYQMITGSNLSMFEYLRLDTAVYAEVRKHQGGDQVKVYEHALDKVMREKLDQGLFHCVYLLQIDAPDQVRADHLLQQMYAHAMQFTTPLNGLIPLDSKDDYRDTVVNEDDDFATDSLGRLSSWIGDKNKDWRKCLLLLSPSEMSALWHLPHDRLTSPQILWNSALQVEAPKSVTNPESGIPIGINRFGSKEKKVYFPRDSRTMHTAIIGKTGTGKSSIAHHLIDADIREGVGVCLIDPTGNLVSAVLQHSIPPEREKDVVILDIDTEVNGVFYPPPMNILSRSGQIGDDVAVGKLMSIIEKVYPDFSTREMGDTLNAVLMTLAKEASPTLLDVRRVLRDETYREHLVTQIDNFTVRDFWDDFEGMKDGQQAALTRPVIRRLRGFYNNPRLLAITCHPDTLDIADLVRQNKIILVSLKADEMRVPTLERWLLGAAFVSQIEMAAMSGAIQQGRYMLYIDEAQNFVTTALPTMLSQVRQFNLGLVVINQFLRQLAGDTLDALMGNVATLVNFEVGDPDARALEPYMRPGFTRDALVALGEHRAAVSLRAGTTREAAFSVETLPPPGYGQGNPAREAYLRELSVTQYTPKSYQVVKGWLDQRYRQPTLDDRIEDEGGSGEDEDFIE